MFAQDGSRSAGNTCQRLPRHLQDWKGIVNVYAVWIFCAATKAASVHHSAVGACNIKPMLSVECQHMQMFTRCRVHCLGTAEDLNTIPFAV